MTNKPVVLIKLFPFRLFNKKPDPVSEPPVIDKIKLQEYITLMLKKEAQKEIKKHNINSVVRSDVQKYQQGEAQGVLTPELLEAMIASSVEKVMDNYKDWLQETFDKLLQGKMDKCNKQKENRNNYNDHLLEYAFVFGVWTFCEFVFLSVHVSFISNNLSFNPILITLLINRTLTH